MKRTETQDDMAKSRRTGIAPLTKGHHPATYPVKGVSSRTAAGTFLGQEWPSGGHCTPQPTHWI